MSPIDRTAFNALVDDDGSNTLGNPWNKSAISGVILDPVDLFVKSGEAPGVQDINNAGSNIFDVVLPTPRSLHVVHVWPNAAAITLRTMTSGRPGDLVLVKNVYDNITWIHHEAVGGPPGTSPFQNRVTSGPTPIAGRQGSALFAFDNNLWRLAQHDQGKAITVPYAAGNYTSNYPGGGTWTVEAADVREHSYFLRGNQLFITLSIINSTVSAGNVVHLSTYFPFKYSGPEVYMPAMLSDAAGSYNGGVNAATIFPLTGADGNLVVVRRGDLVALSGTNAVHLNGQRFYTVT